MSGRPHSGRPDLAVEVGGVRLANPVICGAGEHLIEADGIRAALAAGAGAVIVKSTNESEAARQQLDRTDYALLDSRWRVLPWDFAPPPDASLLCRSGLAPLSFDDWLAQTAALDREAAARAAYVVPSLIPADPANTVALARRIAEAGLRVLEVNVGAPHGSEARPGAIMLERAPDRVRETVAAVRAAVDLPLWIKLTGQSEDVTALVVAARDGGADAVTLMGRHLAMLPDLKTMKPLLGTSAGYGGGWALPLTCRWLALARRAVGPDFPLMGTNGARDGLDVARFMLAGARAVQMTSAVMTGGFGVVSRAIDELTGYLARQNVGATGLVGRAADSLGAYHDQETRPDYWRRFVPPESRGDS